MKKTLAILCAVFLSAGVLKAKEVISAEEKMEAAIHSIVTLEQQVKNSLSVTAAPQTVIATMPCAKYDIGIIHKKADFIHLDSKESVKDFLMNLTNDKGENPLFALAYDTAIYGNTIKIEIIIYRYQTYDPAAEKPAEYATYTRIGIKGKNTRIIVLENTNADILLFGKTRYEAAFTKKEAQKAAYQIYAED